MSRLIRWLLALAVGAGVAVALPAGAAAGAGRTATLDGVQLRYLPAGLGTSTDFEYEYEDVSFVARVWESGSDDAGWSVDLDIEVMRGAGLSSARTLHDWFIAYEDRPADEVDYHAVHIHGRLGWATRDEVFWLVRPGVAVAVTLDAHRWSHPTLMRTARAVRAVRRCDVAVRAVFQPASSGPFADAITRSISQ
jgi:hypothetical protein